MEALLSESRNSLLDLFSALEKKALEASEALRREHDKKVKHQEEEIRVLKEKLAKKDEIMHFHEEEINALRNQVKSLKSEKPLCSSCSQRDGTADPPGRKRLFSPDSSCGRSTDVAPRPAGASKGGLSVKRRRTGPHLLVPETCPPSQPGPERTESFDKAFCLEKTPEKEPEEATPVKEEPSIRLGLNDLSPASVASDSLDVTIGPAGLVHRPLEGPKLGDTLVGSENGRESESSSFVSDSPPLLSLRSAASVARRPSQPRKTRSSGRQLKLHSLTFAPKVNLARQAERLQPRKSAGAAHLQDLDETMLESGGSGPKPPSRPTRSGSQDLPTLGGSPTGPFKRPKPPSASRPSAAAARGASSLPSPEAPRKAPSSLTEDTEPPSLDPIACSTLKVSQESPALSLGSLETPALSLGSLEMTEGPESAVFPAAPARRPLSPLSANEAKPPTTAKPPVPPQSFKFAAPVERRREERRQLPAFSCFECQEYYRGSGLPEAEIQQRMKNCSRHRAKHPPPSTPEGFWDIDLPATPEAKNEVPDAQRKRRRKPYQFPTEAK